MFVQVVMTTHMTVIHTVTPDALRGRVMGVYQMEIGMMPFGGFIAGAVATAYGVDNAFLISGIASLMQSSPSRPSPCPATAASSSSGPLTNSPPAPFPSFPPAPFPSFPPAPFPSFPPAPSRHSRAGGNLAAQTSRLWSPSPVCETFA